LEATRPQKPPYQKQSQEFYDSHAAELLALAYATAALDDIDGGKKGDTSAKGQAKTQRLENLDEYKDKVLELAEQGHLPQVLEAMAAMDADKGIIKRLEKIAHFEEIKEAIPYCKNPTPAEEELLDEARRRYPRAETWGDIRDALDRSQMNLVQENCEDIGDAHVSQAFAVSEELYERFHDKDVDDKSGVSLHYDAGKDQHYLLVGDKSIRDYFRDRAQDDIGEVTYEKDSAPTLGGNAA